MNQVLGFCPLYHPVFYPVAVSCGGQHPQGFELQYKTTDGGIGGITEILFQLLGREFFIPIAGKDKLPQSCFFFRNLSLR